jgi:hypothetical protein
VDRAPHPHIGRAYPGRQPPTGSRIEACTAVWTDRSGATAHVYAVAGDQPAGSGTPCSACRTEVTHTPAVALLVPDTQAVILPIWCPQPTYLCADCLARAERAWTAGPWDPDAAGDAEVEPHPGTEQPGPIGHPPPDETGDVRSPDLPSSPAPAPTET